MKTLLASVGAAGLSGLLLSVAALCPVTAHLKLAAAASPASSHQIDQRIAQGRRAFQRGAFEQAASAWREAAKSYAARGNRAEHIDALVLSADAYQALGQYPIALSTLLAARETAEQIDDEGRMAAVTGSLGKVHLVTGSTKQASRHLRASLALARANGNRHLTIANLNNLGKLLSDRRQDTRARARYRESAQLAGRFGKRSSNLQFERAKAVAGLARLALRDNDHSDADTLLTRAATHIRQPPPSHEGAFGLIALGNMFQKLYTAPSIDASKDMKARWVSAAYRAFVDATAIGESLGDLRAVSYARGYLGQMYALEQRPREALQLTRQALFAAQQADAPEISYRWQWQIARLLK
ncbi:MAG: hypothetical protein H0V34_14760, partial [Gammaproteobacteria bacterium]|nr:hypothetical protein [Gammaproteobacteria bacterium]